MSRIRSHSTKPELVVRKYLHNKGFRFRINGKINKKIFKNGILPGKPDIVLIKYKTTIFIHGCFWHQHKNCNKSHLPKSNTAYWENKLYKNINRDKKINKTLKRNGFKVIVIWECQIKNMKCLDKLVGQIKNEK